MRSSPLSGALSRPDLRPLVRPTRSQAEVELLPPYGDPEVTLLGELGTYLVLGAVAALGFVLVRRRRPDD